MSRLESPRCSVNLLGKRTGCRDPRHGHILRGRQVTRARINSYNAPCRALLKLKRFGPVCTGLRTSERTRRLVLKLRSARHIPCDSKQIGFQINNVTTDLGHLVATKKAECITAGIRVVEFLGNEGVALPDKWASLEIGANIGNGHCVLLFWAVRFSASAFLIPSPLTRRNTTVNPPSRCVLGD